MSVENRQLEERLGHSFQNGGLLELALTHKSVHSTAGAEASVSQDNEQLEFLGDSILGFVTSEFVFRRCPEAPEGKLSRLKAHRVSAAHLYRVATRLGLGQHLKLGRGEEQSGGRTKRAILSNAVEAIIAAIFLDGGLEPSRRFIENQILEPDDEDEFVDEVALDAKSALQELAQASKLPVPRYQIVGHSGPEHAKQFVVEARVGREFAARAEGSSKKMAGQRAAEQLLEQLRALAGAQAESAAADGGLGGDSGER